MEVIAAMSDLHAGSSVGVCMGPVKLDDGGTYQPSKAQQWLAEVYQDYVRSFVGDSVGYDTNLTVLTNGDLFDGDHHDTIQLVSRHPGIEFQIAQRLFEPWFELAGSVNKMRFVFVRGTESHVGRNGSKEEAFARWVNDQGFDVVQDPDTGNYSWWHFRGDFGKLRVDATHHGQIGSRAWTRHNAVMAQACDIFAEHAMHRERHPDIAIRSHFHTHADSHDAYPTRVIQLPAFQLKTGYAHRVAANKLADIGGILVAEDGGVDKYIVHPERGAVWQA